MNLRGGDRPPRTRSASSVRVWFVFPAAFLFMLTAACGSDSGIQSGDAEPTSALVEESGTGGGAMKQSPMNGDTGNDTLNTNPEGDPETVSLPPRPLSKPQERGVALYQHYCAHCHGAGGGGDGPNAYALETAPRNLLDPVFQSGRTDEQLIGVIVNGGRHHGHSRFMPPWGRVLPQRAIIDLVACIHLLPDRQPHAGDNSENAGDEVTDDFAL